MVLGYLIYERSHIGIHGDLLEGTEYLVSLCQQSEHVACVSDVLPIVLVPTCVSYVLHMVLGPTILYRGSRKISILDIQHHVRE